MKIVHVAYGFGIGGIETMLTNIVNEQIKYEHEIHIIVINKIVNHELKDRLDPRITFHSLNRTLGSKNPLPFLLLNLLLFNINPDIIHLHFASISRFILFPSLRKCLCCTQHDTYPAKDKEIKCLYKAGVLFAISNTVQKDIKQKTGLDSIVVSNGVKVNLISSSRHKKRDTFRIVQISRLMHLKKGQHILIQAIKILVDKGIKNISLDFIGDGESINYLETLTNQLKIQAFIHFRGYKDQSYIFSHLCNYDLYVQPSIWEGFGLTVAEAMAAKVPVLVSKNEGPLEIIDYGKYGYYFRNGDASDCAKKIMIFLRGENDKSMIESAYQRVTECYNVNVTAHHYLEEYQKICNN